MRILKVPQKEVFPIFVLSTVVLQVIVLGLLLVAFLSIVQLSRRPLPTLVQLVDGRAIQVGPGQYLERSPETIRRFINDTLTLMFSWSGTIPPETVEDAKAPKSDPGVPVQTAQRGNMRVATSAWQASFALSEEFRKPFVEKLAGLTPADLFNSKGGGTQGLLVIRRMDAPQVLAPGKWKVSVVADLLFFNRQDRIGKAVSFNKEIYVAAVDPPTNPLAEKANGLEQIVYRTRQAGLEIYAIRDLPREDL
jgi:hypothetical protein